MTEIDQSDRQIKMTAEEVTAFLKKVFPQMYQDGEVFLVEKILPFGAHIRMLYSSRLLRPGGTISGPAMFMLADVSAYIAILGAIGPVKDAVTTSLNINFLRRPSPKDMIAETRLIKLGKRLAVAESALYSEGETDMVAQASATYSIPPIKDEVE